MQVPATLGDTAREALEAYRAATGPSSLRAKLLTDVAVSGFGGPAPDAAVYVISVAAELTGLHPQTLRTYERMGLITPGRTAGGGRRYSHHDLELLREIADLTAHGIGIEGVRRILELDNQVDRAAAPQRGPAGRARRRPARRCARPGSPPAPRTPTRCPCCATP